MNSDQPTGFRKHMQPLKFKSPHTIRTFLFVFALVISGRVPLLAESGPALRTGLWVTQRVPESAAGSCDSRPMGSGVSAKLFAPDYASWRTLRFRSLMCKRRAHLREFQQLRDAFTENRRGPREMECDGRLRS